MTFTFFTNCISPHQVPLAKALIKRLGSENYRYVYTDELTAERMAMGWGDVLKEQGAVFVQGSEDMPKLVDADILMSGNRAVGLFEKRNQLNKETWYCSERWFKLPLGFIRVFVPSYFKMAWRFVKCLKCETFKYLPMGIHAARDMARLVGLLSGDVRCLFAAPKVAFESRPGGAIVPLKEAIKAGVLSKEAVAFGQKHGFVQISWEHWGKVKPRKVYAKMRMWGYFVEPSSGNKTTEYTEYTEKDCQSGVNHEIHEMHEKAPAGRTASVKESTEDTEGASRQFSVQSSEFGVQSLELRGCVCVASTDNKQRQTANTKQLTDAPCLRVLWVGRMLDWKRVDTLVKACVSDALKDKVELHLYGHGPEEENLKRLATKGANVFFHDFVPVAQVRDLMRAHDVYVLPSDGGEGWGAVVSEALEEGMQVLGTTGAGSSATILPPTHLFKAGDVKRLVELLSKEIEQIPIGEWTAENGAKALLNHK